MDRKECQRLQDLYGAYALRALAADEMLRVEEHLARCPVCRQEVRELGEGARSLQVLAGEATPPAWLRQRLVAAARELPQVEAPEGLRPRSRVDRRPAPGRRFLLVAGLLFLFLLAPPLLWGETAARRVELLWTGLAGHRSIRDVVLLADPTTRLFPVRGEGPGAGAWGTLALNRRSQRMLLLVKGLPPQEGRVYQVWLMEDGGRESAGLFQAEPGRAALLSHSSRRLGEIDAVGVSLEPEGGSPAPTGPRVLAVNLGF